jgi:hypothetical protein
MWLKNWKKKSEKQVTRNGLRGYELIFEKGDIK